MATQILTVFDFGKNEILNVRMQNLATAPSTPAIGQYYFDTVLGYARQWDGAAWLRASGIEFPLSNTAATAASATTAAAAGAANTAARGDHVHSIPTAVAGSSAVGDAAAVGTSASLARADHKHAREAFGSAVAATTFGLAAANGSAATVARGDHTHGTPAHNAAEHATIPLSSLAAATAAVNLGNQLINNLQDPVSAQDAATKAYVDGLAQGLDAKDSVRAATTANITLTGTQTVDGVSLVADNRVLVKNQSTASANGIYLVKAGAWVRTSDMDQAGEFASAFVFVEQGTVNGDSGWVCTTDNPVVVGTTAITWVQFSGAGQITAGDGLVKTGNIIDVVAGNGIVVAADSVSADLSSTAPPAIAAAGAAGVSTQVARRDHTHAAPAGMASKYATTLVGNSATTSFVVTHNLGTRDVQVQVAENQTPYGVVYTDVEMTSTNTVTVRFAVAPPTATDYRVVVVG